MTKRKTYLVRLFRFKEKAMNLDFNQIYDMAKPKVISMLRAKFPSMDLTDIESSYDSALQHLYEKLEEDQLSDDVTLLRYIYSVARNKLVDELRNRKRTSMLIVEDDSIFDDRWEKVDKVEISQIDSVLYDLVQDIVLHLEYPCDVIIPSRYYEQIKWGIIAKEAGYSSDKSVHSGHKTCLNKIRAVIVEKYRHLCDFL